MTRGFTGHLFRLPLRGRSANYDRKVVGRVLTPEIRFCLGQLIWPFDHLTNWPFDRTFRCLSPMFYQALIRIKMSNKCSDHGNNYYRYKDMFTPYQYICLFICTDLFKCVSFKAHSSTMRSKFSIILPYVDCVDCVGCVVGVRSFYAL